MFHSNPKQKLLPKPPHPSVRGSAGDIVSVTAGVPPTWQAHLSPQVGHGSTENRIETTDQKQRSHFTDGEADTPTGSVGPRQPSEPRVKPARAGQGPAPRPRSTSSGLAMPRLVRASCPPVEGVRECPFFNRTTEDSQGQGPVLCGSSAGPGLLLHPGGEGWASPVPRGSQGALWFSGADGGLENGPTW